MSVILLERYGNFRYNKRDQDLVNPFLTQELTNRPARRKLRTFSAIVRKIKHPPSLFYGF